MDELRGRAERLDRDDTLRHLRHRFVPADGVYLDGNSLGQLPLGVAERVADVVEREWGRGLIASWNSAGWFTLPARVGDRLARLVGAPPGSVMAGDSTSVQLFNTLVAAARLRPGRTALVTDVANFPTDGYVAGSVARLLGLDLVLVDASDELALARALDDHLAVLTLSHVDYRTGALHDMAGITAAVHAAGGVVVWDLAHSAGAVPVDLKGCDVDFAVGCTYKYLNGGPGAPAFGFVHPRWHDDAEPPLTGWLGHAAPFALEQEYRPAAGASRLRVGTPPVLSLAALDAALDVFDGVDMQLVRAKSLALTDLFVEAVQAQLGSFGVQVVVPREHHRRGSQVCLRHPDAYPVVQALIERRVVGDFREPDLARFGFAPLTLRYADVLDAVDTLEQVLSGGQWQQPRFARRTEVT
ncbi:MAG: kynureninase [Jiangellales bacterium]